MRLAFWTCFPIAALILWKSVSWRISHTYLEDDLVWFFPIIDHLLNSQTSILALLKSFHLPELTLFDALYFTFLKSIFGYHFSFYPIPSYLMHLANGILIYQILSRALNCSRFTSGIAAFIYLSFYGHYHAYLWPMAMHHVLGVFWILLFIYEYVQICNKENTGGQDRTELILNLRLYGLAFLTSFMRLSVLIIPLLIGAHIVFTSKSRTDFYSRIKRWIPIFLIISWYQILVLIIGKHGDVLSGFLSMESLVVLTGLIIMLWLLFKRNLQRVFYGWLVVPFIFILCLYLWLFPQNTLTPPNVALRWQVMPLPTGVVMWIFLIALSGWIMYTFTRYALCDYKRFGIFIIWYMLLFPYFVFRLSAMPSRYLIYVSPVFAVVLAVCLGEILANQLKGSYKNVFQVFVGFLLICGAVINIQAIHARSVRSFTADYYWKYDDIMIAQYIKNDLKAKGVLPERQLLCLKGTSRLRYLEDWAQKFLKNQKMDGYESLRLTLASELGIRPSNIRTADVCFPSEISYDFKDDSIFLRSRWPAHLQKEDAWEIYGKRFSGDNELRVDNIIQRQVNFFDDGKSFWSLKQGDRVESYKNFDICDFQKWYFAIPADESFNLARFKIGDYQKSYFAKTKYEIRRQIDAGFPSAWAENTGLKILQNEASYIPSGEYVFKMKLLGIPLGYLYLRNGGVIQKDSRRLFRISIELKPWFWLQKASKDKVGFRMTSLVTEELLPVEFEQIDLMKLKKGKMGRKIVYHHDDLFMERRGYKEDIEADTRDLVSVVLWIFANSYTDQTGYHTTFNIERDLCVLEVIPVFVKNNETFLSLKVNSQNQKRKKHNGFVSLRGVKEGDVPESIILKVGLVKFSFTLL